MLYVDSDLYWAILWLLQCFCFVLTVEATSAMLPNTSVFPAQSTAAEAILLRCVLLLVSYLGGSMSIFSIYTKKRQTQICLWDTLGLAAVMWCSWHLSQACGGTENRSVLPCGAGSIWAPREACSRGHPFLCCVLLVKTFIAQYLYTYVYIYIYTYVCVFFKSSCRKKNTGF